MTHRPRTKEDIYKSLRSSLKNKISTLTNFTEQSFNFTWTQAFSEEVRRVEVETLVAELAGWIDYSGGPVTQDDLEDLGLEDELDPSDVNDLMDDEYLDELVKLVGVTRFEGAKATGTVDIDTQSAQTTIPKGTTVTTSPDSDGSTTDFVTTEKAETPAGVTQVQDVNIEAAEVGAEFNVAANTIIRFSSPPVGVTAVTNNASTTGGEDRESNEDLRSRAKTATQESSEGGTVSGIEGYIKSEIGAVRQNDVLLEEFVDKQPPYVDVIVDGGTDSEVKDAIEFSRPAGIRHNLIRPQIVQVGLNTFLLGDNIDTTRVENDANDFLLELGIGEELYQDKLVQEILQSDDNIENIDRLGGTIERVTSEQFTYDNTQTDYRLWYTYDTNGSITIEDDAGNTYTQSTDYTVEDQTGDGHPETIVWQNNATPNDGQDYTVDYDVTHSSTPRQERYEHDLVRDEILTFNLNTDDTLTYNTGETDYRLDSVPFDETESISDNSGDTYIAGKDYIVTSVDRGETTDTFTYSSGTYSYSLSETVNERLTVTDSNGEVYDNSVDFTVSGSTLDWSVDVGAAVADDGGSTTDQTTEANDSTDDDMTLLPASPALDDAYYIGYVEQFDGFDLDISTAGAGTWDIVWEYYDGGSWTALSNVSDGTSDFRNSGINSVTWDRPTNWATTTVASISGLYWVRARLDTFTSISTQPLGKQAHVGIKPADSTDFTARYNGFNDVIKFDTSESTPDPSEDFTVTYDQRLYRTTYEIVETQVAEIDDESNNTYNEGTDYELVDYSQNYEDDSIFWSSNPGSLGDGDEFYITYFNEGDVFVDNRSKIDPGSVTVQEK